MYTQPPRRVEVSRTVFAVPVGCRARSAVGSARQDRGVPPGAAPQRVRRPMTNYDHDTDPSTPGAKRPADQKASGADSIAAADIGSAARNEAGTRAVSSRPRLQARVSDETLHAGDPRPTPALRRPPLRFRSSTRRPTSSCRPFARNTDRGPRTRRRQTPSIPSMSCSRGSLASSPSERGRPGPSRPRRLRRGGGIPEARTGRLPTANPKSSSIGAPSNSPPAADRSRGRARESIRRFGTFRRPPAVARWLPAS